MDFKYSVPIIPHNLSQNETVVQIAEVLDHLSNITDTIFQHVNKKLEVDQSRLSNISQRLDAVKDKVNKLRDVKKAIQVFSSSRYPASNVNKDYVSVFHDITPVEIKRHKVKFKNYSSTSHEPLEKLQIYHVSDTCENGDKINDVGKIRTNVQYVNDLSTCGTDIFKNLPTSDVTKSPTNTSDILELDDAPCSISERSILNKSIVQSQNFFYTPSIGEVPSLDVPLDLPDLPGVPDDLNYDNKDESFNIAPSILLSSTFIDMDLPKIDSDSINKEVIPQEILPPPISQEELSKPSLKEEEPVPQEVKEEQQTSVEVEETSGDTQTDSKVSSLKIEAPIVNDARSSLMEAIRNIGGVGKAKLRHVADTEKETASPPAAKVILRIPRFFLVLY
ncbi:unnamed protein product [Acanthoscelides obtectus]|uniref:WH2 domain-containing protein n=1 Tax=Acanthoscelides obtectus TaxID=200917 RepID=A0A9P0NZK2_ACAOB|nr:unnamed protein product [Acanthoscelides obtectus]CAK1627505.1 WASH complex subunit 1 [Acanthoscelides obtectus]